MFYALIPHGHNLKKFSAAGGIGLFYLARRLQVSKCIGSGTLMVLTVQIYTFNTLPFRAWKAGAVNS